MSATRISKPIVISAYSVGAWNNGRMLSIRLRKRAASKRPDERSLPPARLAPPSTAAAMLSSAWLPMIGEPICTSAAR